MAAGTAVAGCATGAGAASRRRAIVVGAGLAGIGAAQTLQDRGFEVVLLEARDRIGGRVWTVDRFRTKIDLGASWIHDSRGNPLTEVARRAGLQTVPTEYDRVKLRYPGEREVADSQLERLMETRDSVISSLYRRARRQPGGSLAPALRSELARRSLTAADRQVLDWLLGVEIPLDLGTDPGDLSLDGFYEGETWSGGPDLMIRGGASGLVDALARGIEARTGAQVTAVRRSGSGVEVRLAGGESLSADGCVVTVPLGVLKQGSVRFDPPLPSKTRRAISKVGFGLLEKSFLSYERAWWPGGVTQLGTVGQPLAKTVSAFPLEQVSGKPILCAFTGGAWAQQLERAGSSTATVTEQLEAGFGAAVTPAGSLSTEWHSDPFARGSYSHLPPGTTASARADLGRLAGRVILAGEHTSIARPSTMDGAWIAGQKAARRLASAIR